ncbi:hypothetical protein [Chryseolinea lacunae]|uniref:Uncharacterized protein n=1 Tax=Chryseolinea lacunae TaxID=2801331 RepID=A0ABS1KTE0_9BACT|nr:hypothetical protein [Chryseolinea lacunae]MBL0742625.1 hypothetical protein [Chryseolinea lacunae]
MKKENIKERFIGVEFRLDEITKEELSSLQIGFGLIDGALTVVLKTDDREILTNAIRGYQRKNKPGFNLKKIYHKSNSGSLEPQSFLKDTDAIFAIDTNEKRIGKVHMSVGVVAGLELKAGENGTFNINATVKDYIHFQDSHHVEKNENRSWKTFIENYNRFEENRSLKTTIVVDSDLGLLDKYNNRNLPIYQDFFLPPNISLVYASADVSNDTIINKMITFCDEESSRSLKDVEKELYKTFHLLRDSLIKKHPDKASEIISFFESH